MSDGVIEWQGVSGAWWPQPLIHSRRRGWWPWMTLDENILAALAGHHHYPLRYREGNRAVMLWPESEIGKVVAV